MDAWNHGVTLKDFWAISCHTLYGRGGIRKYTCTNIEDQLRQKQLSWFASELEM